QLAVVADRAAIDGQRAGGRLQLAGGSGDGDGGAVDRAGAGRIQQPVNRDNAARDRRALQIERRAGIHLHIGGGAIGDGQALENERGAAAGRQQLAVVADRAAIDGQRAGGRLQLAGGSGDGDGGAVDRAGAGRIQQPVNRDNAARDRRALQIERRAGIHLHIGGGAIGDGQALENERGAAAGRQQLAVVADRAAIDGQRAGGRLQLAGGSGDGDG